MTCRPTTNSCDTLTPAQSPERASWFGDLLGQHPSLHALRWRLPPLFGHFVGTTVLSDSPPACVLVSSLIAFSSRSGVLLPDACGVSRFSRMEFPGMPGVSDCAGFMNVSRLSSPMMLPSASPNSVGTPDEMDFAAQYPACLSPCQRFARRLTTAHA